ncbi:MAG: class II fructose-bisphosphate aldolase [Actinobacteria bacterium]|nr:class II fructose-bisphosphate aldolase [Actinomycetota bacterium]
MAYVNTKEMLSRARHEGYAVGAFNIVDYTTMEAVVMAAHDMRAPVIIQTSQKTVEQMGFDILPAIARTLAARTDVPVAMILDHGTKMDVIEGCIAAGWTSVMIDASAYPFDENVRLTKHVVELAHGKGITVEGELGHIGGKEEHIDVETDQELLTEPEMVVKFHELTGVDSLAVGIGTKHGLYKSKDVKLDFDRLGKIMELTDFPIIIHGCSDLSDENINRLVSYHPSKMNISTEIKYRYLDSYTKYINDHPDEYEPIKCVKYVLDEVYDLVKGIMIKFGSAGKA